MSALGSDMDQMNSADTIDKTIAAALGNILDATFGQVMKTGLASLSSHKRPEPKAINLGPLKTTVKNSFTPVIEQEQRYKGYKEKTLNLYTNAVMKVSALIGCESKKSNYTSSSYKYKGEELSLSNLLTILKEKMNQSKDDVDNSEKLLKQVESLNGKVDEATSATEIQNLMIKFSAEVRSFVHSSEKARKELESETDEINLLIDGNSDNGTTGVDQDRRDCLSSLNE